METKNGKSRHLSPLEFVEKLIEEWFLVDTRAKISPIVKDKKYNGRLAKYKREKIMDICSEKGIPCLFSDNDEWQNYIKLMYPQGGMPMFLKEKEDIENYYAVGNDVMYLDRGMNNKGKIVSFDYASHIVEVKDWHSGESNSITSNYVKRIL